MQRDSAIPRDSGTIGSAVSRPKVSPVRSPDTSSGRPGTDRALHRRIIGPVRSAGRRILNLLPRAPVFDYLYFLVCFVERNRRLPRRGSGLMNDYLFYMKTDGVLTDPLVRFTTDKVYAKYFIDQVAGLKVTPETYAVFGALDAIRRSALPDRCVLKAAHGTGSGVVFLDGPDDPITEADWKTLRRALAFDAYADGREANYRYLRKRLLCEELIESPERIKDYRLFCYRGRVKLVTVLHQWHAPQNLARKIKPQNVYDRAWNPLDVVQNDRPQGPWEPMPEPFAEMCALAERIAAHFEFVRVDMFLTGERIYVGELTHCHGGGHSWFRTLEEERLVSGLLFG